MFKYFFYRFALMFTSLFPVEWCYGIAHLIARIQFYCSPRDRAAVIDNLQQILGNREKAKRLAVEVFRHFACYLVEFFRMGQDLDDAFISRKVELQDFDLLKQGLAKGRGVILLTGHIGNWELGGLVISCLGYPFTAIALPHKERPVNELFNSQREKFGVKIVPAHLAIRRCLKDLKDNRVVAILADRDFSVTGEARSVFGKTMMIPKGAALFAYRTGAAVIPAFLRRNPDHTFRLAFGPVFDLPEDPHQMMEDVFVNHFLDQQVKMIEQEVRRDPAQWMMFRRFWFDQTAAPERITST
ncbi:MAG TPA: lysophospholipid acyltransferase family protein [Candidatus Omnitrophota bacterium]|jgi:KDO2-lipid IV(A) lauroyltransferase|nr:lysophospholipid acyltransferase family protein [Candidatus Omnitrophota bacterium]HSA31593.1 lysophospholipid acyltransferase family protein [Candidatus Omnitrophota bacterium]